MAAAVKAVLMCVATLVAASEVCICVRRLNVSKINSVEFG